MVQNRKESLIVVENDGSWRRILADFLQVQFPQYEVEAYSMPTEVMQRLGLLPTSQEEESQPVAPVAAIFIGDDLGRTGMTGEKLFNIIRDEYGKVPVLASSTNDDLRYKKDPTLRFFEYGGEIDPMIATIKDALQSVGSAARNRKDQRSK